MKALIQRVLRAQVSVGSEVVGAIGPGLLVLLGVGHGDTEKEAERLALRTAQLRVFADDDGRFYRSVQDIGGALLVVSQFTLMADTKKGNRPSFVPAAAPDVAEPLVQAYVAALRATGRPVETGRFGAHMVVSLENDGPVTVLLEAASSVAQASQC